MNLALMFNVKPGGEIEAIKWSKDNFLPDISIIVLDEGSESLFLWHGVQQGLVARRTALRQAESLKGHGYTVGKSIIGRDIKIIKEIDARKVGKVPEDTDLNNDLQSLLDQKFTELNNFIITFQEGAVAPLPTTPTVKEEQKVIVDPKAEIKPEPVSSVAKPLQPVTYVPKPIKTVPSEPKPMQPVEPIEAKKPVETGSEYEDVGPLPSIKDAPEKTATPSIQVSKSSLTTSAKVSFVFGAILDHFDDIWISKKNDGSYSIEEMDGPICTFHLKEGSKINFSTNSFNRIDPKIKTAIQKKFIELTKLI
ncbi:MAG: hypothetical protein ACW96S_02790 [Promethearchaeota archaeon]